LKLSKGIPKAKMIWLELSWAKRITKWRSKQNIKRARK